MRSDNWHSQIGFALDKYVLPEIGHLSLEEIKLPLLQVFQQAPTKDQGFECWQD